MAINHDGPGYKNMDDHATVNLVAVPEENTHDEEEGAEENAELSYQKNQCRVSDAEAM